MPLILPGNVASATASTTFSVDNSCRYNDDDTPRLHIASLGTATDVDKWTFSCWFKRSTLSSSQYLLYAYTSGEEGAILLNSSDCLDWYNYPGSSQGQLITNRKFRDVGAWYHLVCAHDSDNGTAGNRMRIYINGTEETSFSTDTNPTLDENTVINRDLAHNIGLKYSDAIQNNFDGYLAEVCFIDGQQLTPSSFGEFDEDSPTIWKPIDISELTFGDNGFYFPFSDSADLGADSSGNSNDFTSTNLAATDQASDSPTNNFCTMNPLDNYYGAGTFSEGNLKIVTLSSDYTYYTGTIGLTAGLWYFEAKLTATADDNQVHVGIAGRVTENSQHELGHYNDTYAYYSADGDSRTNDGDTSYGDGFDTGDILGVYIDLNANKLYFAKNGVVQNSGTGISITAPASVTSGAYFPAVGDWANQSATWEVNFGNPSYTGTDKDDKNGYGSFEYDPSVGTFDSASKDFLAICTKNLGSDGG